jgi:BioD-like phosphotransacetylase family protein
VVGRVRVVEVVTNQVRVNLEQQRTENDELKKNLETKDDKLKEIKKEQDNTHKSASLCKT